MSAFIEKLRHAFAVDAPGPAEPTAEQQAPVDWFCRQIATRRLTTPGLIALEVSRPMNFVAAQVMHFFAPAVWALARPSRHEDYERFAAFLERRGSIEYLAARVEHFEAELRAARAGRGGDARGPGRPASDPAPRTTGDAPAGDHEPL